MLNYCSEDNFFPDLNDGNILKDIVDSSVIYPNVTNVFLGGNEKRYPDFSFVLNSIQE